MKLGLFFLHLKNGEEVYRRVPVYKGRKACGEAWGWGRQFPNGTWAMDVADGSGAAVVRAEREMDIAIRLNACNLREACLVYYAAQAAYEAARKAPQ